MYGQFIYFDDFSQYFNGFRKKFTLTQTNGGTTEIIDLRKGSTPFLLIGLV